MPWEIGLLTSGIGTSTLQGFRGESYIQTSVLNVPLIRMFGGSLSSSHADTGSKDIQQCEDNFEIMNLIMSNPQFFGLRGW